MLNENHAHLLSRWFPRVNDLTSYASPTPYERIKRDRRISFMTQIIAIRSCIVIKMHDRIAIWKMLGTTNGAAKPAFKWECGDRDWNLANLNWMKRQASWTSIYAIYLNAKSVSSFFFSAYITRYQFRVRRRRMMPASSSLEIVL